MSTRSSPRPGDPEPVLVGGGGVEHARFAGGSVDGQALRSDVGSPRREEHQPTERAHGLAHREERQETGGGRGGTEEAASGEGAGLRRGGALVDRARERVRRTTGSLAPMCTTRAPMVIHADQ